MPSGMAPLGFARGMSCCEYHHPWTWEGTMESINWADRGISWQTEDVSKQHGSHATDKVVIGKAQIPVVTDLEKFRSEYGDACVLGILDGTSIRVMAQDVNRTSLAKGLKADEIKARIDARLRGIRNRPLGGTTVVTKLVYVLPNGEKYTGTSLVEFQSEYMAALVDAGVPAEVARTLAEGQNPEGLK